MPIDKINIAFIPEDQQRYETLGDWWVSHGAIEVRASGPTEDDQFLIGLHEMIEAYLCQKRGIDQTLVDAHDNLFATEGHPDEAEPGDDPRAPYRKEHRFAMLIEHMVAHELGLTDYGVIR